MPFQGVGPAQFVGQPPPNSQNILNAISLWVDSVNGVDTNPGTQALPLKTLARALVIRQSWGRGYASFFIHLVGAGPYTTGTANAGFSTFLGGLFIQGDTAAETIHLTGSFTGAQALGVFPTTAGLGSDTQRGRFLRITSGTNAGRELQILENTDTSVTFVSNANVFAVANGVTFDIISPGTSLTFGSSDWPGTATLTVFHRLLFTSLGLTNVNATFATCRSTGSPTFTDCNLIGGTSQGTALGLPSANSASESGLAVAANSVTFTNTQFAGRIVAVLGTSGSAIGSKSLLTLAGARFTSNFTITNQADFFVAGTGTNNGFFRFDGPLFVQENAILRIGAGGNPYGLIKFAVTNANSACIRAQRNGTVIERLTAANPPSGGASAGSSYGHDASGGGRIFIYGGTPALTGGAGDLRVTGVTAANATLNVADTFVGAAASPYGDLIARVGS